MLCEGDRVAVRKLRWGAASPKWESTTTIRDVSADGFTTLTPAGTEFRMADGSVWNSRDAALDHYWHGAWHQVMELTTPGPRWYVNVMSPLELRAGVLSWCDLDIDIEAFADGTFQICDVPGFVRARESYPAEFDEHVRKTVISVVGDIRAKRPPFRKCDWHSSYGSEESRFRMSPGAGDGIAVVGDLPDGTHRSIERMLAHQNPASVHAAASSPLMFLPEGDPPRDGLLIGGTIEELPALLQHAKAAAAMYGGRAYMTLAVTRDHEADPLAEFLEAVGEGSTPLVIQFDGALRGAGVPPREVAASQHFVAASWF